jgi:hypothetical protein
MRMHPLVIDAKKITSHGMSRIQIDRSSLSEYSPVLVHEGYLKKATQLLNAPRKRNLGDGTNLP